MGSISSSSASIVEMLTEILGFKAGLVIERESLCEFLDDYDPALARILSGEETHWIRLHSSTFEEIVAHLLFKVGNIGDPSIVPPILRMYHKNKGDPSKLERYTFIFQSFNDMISSKVSRNPDFGTKMDPSSFLRAMTERYGTEGYDLAMEMIQGLNHQMHISPWGAMRETEWRDAVELSDLFSSEDLGTLHGQFFDQRFIDYLHANFEKLSDINWRKFEGLAAEFFEREGFAVDIGPGRNDDGVDLRVYPHEADTERPPLIIVQCKRQREKIGKTLLKALYADVVHEGAESGLIVTSSWLAPGTETMRTARNYPIEAVDRDALRTWIGKLKTERYRPLL